MIWTLAIVSLMEWATTLSYFCTWLWLNRMQWLPLRRSRLDLVFFRYPEAARVNKLKVIQLRPVFGRVPACLHSMSKALVIGYGTKSSENNKHLVFPTHRASTICLTRYSMKENDFLATVNMHAWCFCATTPTVCLHLTCTKERSQWRGYCVCFDKILCTQFFICPAERF